MNISQHIPSQAEVFFRNLSHHAAGAFAQLSALVAEGAEENEWRDFKEAAFIDAPISPGSDKHKEVSQRQEKVKKIWSENLSAFANSSGGVLIWGIRAPKEKAEELSLAGDAKQLEARLRQLQNDMVDPPVQGVEIRAVTEATDSTKGFVVCFIPGSIFKPHRAVRAEKEYYFRVGDSNRTIPTGMLRALFHPTFVPWLVPECDIALVNGARSELAIQISVKLTNRGMASAQDAFVNVTADFPDISNDIYPYNDAWQKRQFSNGGFDCRRSIHPGETIPFISNLAGSGIQRPPDDEAVFTIRFEIFSHNAPGIRSFVKFTGSELKEGRFQRGATTNLISDKS